MYKAVIGSERGMPAWVFRYVGKLLGCAVTVAFNVALRAQGAVLHRRTAEFLS